VRTLGGQRVQAVPGAPGQVAAQVRFGVLAGGALEAGQVRSRCQPQPVSERHQGIGGYGGLFGEGHHALTVRRSPSFRKLPQAPVTARGCGSIVGYCATPVTFPLVSVT
jgi:hypothetical protein